jgi:hypothetical protein
MVMLPTEKEGIVDKLAARTAWLTGRNDPEREKIREDMKKVYNARSRTTHRGTKSKKKEGERVDLKTVRDICRRALSCLILVAGRFENENDIDDFLSKLATSREFQDIAQEEAIVVGSLTHCY